MSIEFIADRVIDSIDAFVAERGLQRFELVGCDCNLTVMDCIALWVESGYGVRACSGDFQTYLMAVIVITDVWMSQPSLFDCDAPDPADNEPTTTANPRYTPTSISDRTRSCSVHARNDGWNHRAFSQQWFATQVFEFQHPSQ